MVKVCAGKYYQKYHYLYYDYPNGDKRRKKELMDGWGSRLTTITKEFAICKYPVTQGQWKAIMGEGMNLSYHRGDDNLPVENVSWEEVQEFIQKLNKLTGKKYRLPTEAEWQWAANGAGKDIDRGDWSGCNDENSLSLYAWYKDNSGNTTHPVGEKRPNELGIYDMTGNVCEMCQDNSVERHNLGSSPAVDPCVKNGSADHVGKGGTFDYPTISCINCTGGVFREGGTRSKRFGFRLAQTLK